MLSKETVSMLCGHRRGKVYANVALRSGTGAGCHCGCKSRSEYHGKTGIWGFMWRK